MYFWKSLPNTETQSSRVQLLPTREANNRRLIIDQSLLNSNKLFSIN